MLDFVDWHIHSIAFLPLFAFSVYMFFSSLCCWCFFCLQYLAFSYSFYVVFESSHRHYLQFWRALVLLLFLTYTGCFSHLWDIRLYESPLGFLFSSHLLFTLKIVPSILKGGHPSLFYFYLWLYFYYIVLILAVFSFTWDTPFLNLFISPKPLLVVSLGFHTLNYF